MDTPDYVKAKEERDHRMKRYGLNVAVVGASVTVVGALIAAAAKIFSK